MATKFKNGIDASSQKIQNVATPTADYDAVTKKYVDDRDAAVTANKGYYGEWQSDQNQPYGGTTVVDQAYAMFFEVNDGSSGIRVVSNDGSNSDQSKTRLTFDYAGTYNVQWSGQFQNTSNSDHDANVWIRKNGTDVFGSNGIVSIPSSHGGTPGHIISSWNFIFTFAAGDYIELIWSTENAGVRLLYSAGVTRTPSSNSVPSTASVIVTAQQVMYIQTAAETTGISSGSVLSGTAIGTGNKAIDYSAISNGLQISGTSPNQTVTVKPKTSGGITVDSTGVSLTSNTISGVALGSNLSALSQGTGISTFSYTGAGTATVAIDTNKVPTISTSSYTTTFTPSASTTVTLPTGATSTLARTDAGQTFTGTNTFSNTITGSVSGNAETVTNGAYINVANTFTGTQTVQAASTQDSVKIAGRAGGTNSYGVTITPTTLTASRTLTVPNVDGTVVTTGDTGTVTSTMILDATIVNGDISSSANIAPTKVQQASVMLTPSVAQTVPNASQTNLALDTVTNYGSYSGILAGTAGTYSSGTHSATGKITASVACAVSASGFILWTNTTTNIRALVIRRYNSSNVLLETVPISQIPQGAAFTATAGTVNFVMNANDYITLTGYQNSGGVLGYSTTNTSAFLRVTVLGGGV